MPFHIVYDGSWAVIKQDNYCTLWDREKIRLSCIMALIVHSGLSAHQNRRWQGAKYGSVGMYCYIQMQFSIWCIPFGSSKNVDENSL